MKRSIFSYIMYSPVLRIVISAKEVMFLPLCVCLSVCLSVSRIGQAQKVVQRILMIFGMKECATSNS